MDSDDLMQEIRARLLKIEGKLERVELHLYDDFPRMVMSVATNAENIHKLSDAVGDIKHTNEKLDKVVVVLNNLEGANKVFTTVGNGLKWLATVFTALAAAGAAIMGFIYSIKHWASTP